MMYYEYSIYNIPRYRYTHTILGNAKQHYPILFLNLRILIQCVACMYILSFLETHHPYITYSSPGNFLNVSICLRSVSCIWPNIDVWNHAHIYNCKIAASIMPYIVLQPTGK